jgi:hypothetical protein
MGESDRSRLSADRYVEPIEAETIMKVIRGREVVKGCFTGSVLELTFDGDLRLRVCLPMHHEELDLWIALK